MESSPLHFAVLRQRREVAAAERELRKRGLLPPPPSLPNRLLHVLRSAAGRPAPSAALHPDARKSWDVLRTIDAVTSSTDRDSPVLDVGSVASAVLPALHRLGYRRLSGIDLDARVLEMPYAGEIEYAVGDATTTTWPDANFAAITAISVIEHGIPAEALLDEIARLLQPGGIFVFSTDYWPTKIETGTTLFGLPWQIFSADDVSAFVAIAKVRGLYPVVEPDESVFAADERAIAFAGHEYTFLHGAFVRR